MLPIEGYLCCLRFGTIMNKAFINIHVQTFWININLHFSGISAKECNFCSICWLLVTQSCLTLRDPVYCSPPGSSVHGILRARILEWIAISFSIALNSSHLFSFFKETAKLFLWVPLPFYILPSSMNDPVSLHPNQHLLLLKQFFILAILISVWWYLIVIFIFVSLIVNEVEYLSMCLIANCITSLLKYFFSHVLNRFFAFSCFQSLYIF